MFMLYFVCHGKPSGILYVSKEASEAVEEEEEEAKKGKRASERVSSSVLFSPLCSPLLFFGALFSDVSQGRQAGAWQFVSDDQSHLCLYVVVVVSSYSSVSWNILKEK